MIKALLYYILLVAVLGFLGCAIADHGVVVIEKTQTYHRKECARVNMAKVETMTTAEAKSRHYQPCPYCRPDSEQ